MAGKTLFDHISAITNNQKITYFDELSDIDMKSFAPYLINMGLSMNPDFLPVVNETNKFWDELGPREIYLFYSQIIPKGKYYNKWIKGEKNTQYDEWLLERVSKHYQISQSEAHVYLDIFYKTDNGRIELKQLLEGYGISPKQLKKVKL